MKGSKRKDIVKHGQSGTLAAAGLVLCVFLVFAVAVPLFSPVSYSEMMPDSRNLPPSAAHFFGTDQFGRDLWIRCWYGAGLSLFVGISCMAVNGIVGLIWGMTAGYGGRKADAFLMRIADVLAAVPSLLYVILILVAFGRNVTAVIAGISVTGWIDMARIVRTEVIRQKHMNYISSMRLNGMSAVRICFVHILPNIRTSVSAALISLVPQAVFAEAFLSFLGVGIAAPQASLGTLLYEAKSQMRLYPYQVIFPVVILCTLMITCMALERGIEEAYGVGNQNKKRD